MVDATNFAISSIAQKFQSLGKETVRKRLEELLRSCDPNGMVSAILDVWSDESQSVRRRFLEDAIQFLGILVYQPDHWEKAREVFVGLVTTQRADALSIVNQGNHPLSQLDQNRRCELLGKMTEALDVAERVGLEQLQLQELRKRA